MVLQLLIQPSMTGTSMKVILVQYLTYAQGFAWSSNVAMTSLEQKMGNDKWLNYLSKFKFGYPTRFGMVNEGSGLLPSDNEVTIAMSHLTRYWCDTGSNAARLYSYF